MIETILANEAILRLSFFVGVLTIMAIWEAILPRKQRLFSRKLRWTNNLAITLVSTLLVRLTFPIMAVGAASFAEKNSFGLLHLINLPFWPSLLFSLMAMDFVIYLQHVLFHTIPILWRLHRVHHADLDIDVTTGIRFHPIEIILSMGIKLVIVLIIGPPVVAVLLFEILLNATALFNHSNAYIPKRVDTVLRWLLVTPDMHRVHHSTRPRETNSNFGFNITWWDRIFGTYINQPADGHKGMTIGLDCFRTAKDLRIDQMLIQPFKKAPD